MVDLAESFTQEVVTERELKSLVPDWPSSLIRDYISFKRNVLITSEVIDSLQGQIDVINARLDVIESDIALLQQGLRDAFQLIAELIADNGKLRARINRQDEQIKNANQIMAGLE